MKNDILFLIDFFMSFFGYVSRKREHDIVMKDNRILLEQYSELENTNENIVEVNSGFINMLREKDELIERYTKALNSLKNIQEELHEANEKLEAVSVGQVIHYTTDYIKPADILKLGQKYQVTREETAYMKESSLNHEGQIRGRLLSAIVSKLMDMENIFYKEKDEFSGNINYIVELNVINKRMR